MIIRNRLDQSFGPSGTSAGILLFLAGLVASFYTFYGIILLLLGAFLGSTYTQSKIDIIQKKAKFSENLFGILSFGTWIEIQPEMKLGISKRTRRYSVSSQSNKRADLQVKDFRIVLTNANGEKIMDLKKFKTLQLAEEGLVRFSQQLEIDSVTKNTNP